jgi:hypothetical protein
MRGRLWDGMMSYICAGWWWWEAERGAEVFVEAGLARGSNIVAPTDTNRDLPSRGPAQPKTHDVRIESGRPHGRTDVLQVVGRQASRRKMTSNGAEPGYLARAMVFQFEEERARLSSSAFRPFALSTTRIISSITPGQR